jgi:hypothetical protein
MVTPVVDITDHPRCEQANQLDGNRMAITGKPGFFTVAPGDR